MITFFGILFFGARVDETAIVAPDAGETISPVQQISVIDLVLGSGPVVQAVLVLLLVMSVLTWGIVITKYFQLRVARRHSRKFSDIFWSKPNIKQIYQEAQQLSSSPVASIYGAGYRELHQVTRTKDGEPLPNTDSFRRDGLENIERALKRAKAEELLRLERGTTFLATTASAAPFIGLFGTVWGIMNAFIGLSQVQSSSIQAVAPGISEALIATAIGLAAAIPAAIFYNYFSQQVRIMSRNMDMFTAEFLNIARRHFLK